MMTIVYLSILIGVILMFVDAFPKEWDWSQKFKSLSYYGYWLVIIGFAYAIPISLNYNENVKVEISFQSEFIDFIKALAPYAWPVVAVIGLLWLTPKILNFLGSRSIQLPGLGINLVPDVTQQQQTTEDTRSSPQSENIPLNDRQKEILNDINNRAFASNEDKTQTLAIWSAFFIDRYQTERIYHAIWGTQLAAISALENNEKLDLSSFYKTHIGIVNSINPGSVAVDFEAWVKFLTANKLVTSEGNNYSITNKGRSLLHHIRENKYNFTKQY